MSFGELLEEPQDLMDNLRDIYLPSRDRRLTTEEKAKYIRSFADTDWSNVFKTMTGAEEHEKERERRNEDNLLKHYTDDSPMEHGP